MGAHRLDYVGHHQDLRAHEQLLRLQPAGIAGTVEPLVMLVDDLGDRLRQIRRTHDGVAGLNVRLHEFELESREPTRPAENLGGDADLAHVVQMRRYLEVPDIFRIHLQLVRDSHRQGGDSALVTRRVRIACFYYPRQSNNNSV